VSGEPLTSDLPCAVHGYHWPPPMPGTVEVHHVWPLGMGGPNVPALPDGTVQKVPVCPTGHYNIHRAMRQLIHGETPTGTRREVELARSGFASWVAAGKPGTPE
jgi:hypothetical protein